MFRSAPPAFHASHPIDNRSSEDPLVALSFCSSLSTSSLRTSGQSRQETFLPGSIASGRMCNPGRLSFVARRRHVPVHVLLLTREREIEAALRGPLAVADIEERSFVAKL